MENNVKIFNTLTRKVETLVPNEDGKVKMYTCGPTVYICTYRKSAQLYYGRCIRENTSLCRL